MTHLQVRQGLSDVYGNTSCHGEAESFSASTCHTHADALTVTCHAHLPQGPRPRAAARAVDRRRSFSLALCGRLQVHVSLSFGEDTCSGSAVASTFACQRSGASGHPFNE